MNQHLVLTRTFYQTLRDKQRSAWRGQMIRELIIAVPTQDRATIEEAFVVSI